MWVDGWLGRHSGIGHSAVFGIVQGADDELAAALIHRTLKCHTVSALSQASQAHLAATL
jgi:hypothetical protein